MSFKFYDRLPSYDAAEVFYVRLGPGICRTQELLRSLYYMLWFPGYFGFNWDALYDCLTDFDWIPCKKIVVVHANLPSIPREELNIYLKVLWDSVLDWDGDDTHELEIYFPSSDRDEIDEILNN